MSRAADLRKVPFLCRNCWNQYLQSWQSNIYLNLVTFCMTGMLKWITVSHAWSVGPVFSHKQGASKLCCPSMKHLPQWAATSVQCMIRVPWALSRQPFWCLQRLSVVTGVFHLVRNSSLCMMVTLDSALFWPIQYVYLQNHTLITVQSFSVILVLEYPWFYSSYN